MFSGSIESDQWHEIGLEDIFCISYWDTSKVKHVIENKFSWSFNQDIILSIKF